MAIREPVEPQSMRKSYACDECKRRKIRCSGGDRCSNCSKDSRACQYSSPSQKLSSLQRRLRESEVRRRDVERLWKFHLPDVDLEDALEKMRSQSVGIDDAVPKGHSDNPTGSSVSASVAQDEETEAMSATLTECGNAEDYEFDESKDLESVIDGMAFLTPDPHKAGYTGPPSGIAALKFLQSLPPYLPTAYASPLSALNDHDFTDAPTNNSTSVNQYLDAYFELYHPAYPILHEGTFRARVAGAVAKPRDGSWALLYNSVLAIGAFVSDTNSTKFDMPFLAEARRHLSMDILEKGSLSYVQALVLLANYLQKRNKPNAGFILIGIAYSMALAIGLHREFAMPTTSAFTMEIRRRVWWTLFVFVSGSQLALGRPAASLVGVNIRLPTNLNDNDLAVDLESLPEARPYPTVSSCLIGQVKLTKIANIIHDELLTHHRPSYAKALELEERIRTWTLRLPPYFDQRTILESFEFPKRVLLWRSFNLRIVLNRPFLFESIATSAELNVSSGPVSSCLSAAAECITSVCAFLRAVEIKRGFAWYATTWLITASFVQATCLIYSPTHELAASWEASLSEAIACLQLLGSSHDIAIRARDILQQAIDQRGCPDPFPGPTFATTPGTGSRTGLADTHMLHDGQGPYPMSSAGSQSESFAWPTGGPGEVDFLGTVSGFVHGSLFDVS